MPSLTYKQLQNKDLWILDLEDIEKETSKLIIRNRINNKMFSSSKKKFVKNDVLYGKLRPYLDKVLVADEDGICTTEIVPIRIYKDVLPEYLRYILKSPFFLNYVNNLTYGVKMQRLGTDDAENALLPIPPLSEQKKIVDILDCTIDAIEIIDIEKVDLSELIKQTKSKVLDLAIKGKLVPQDPNDEPADKLLERIREEKEKLIKESKLKRDKNETWIFKNSDDNSYYEKIDNETICIDDDLPFEIPYSWRWCRLRNIGQYKKGPFGSALTKSIFVPKSENTIKVYEQKNAIQKDASLGSYYITNEYYKRKMKSFRVFPGEIIVSCAGTIGETYILPSNIEKGIINQALMRISLTKNMNINYFLNYFDFILKHEAIENSQGTAIKNIPPFDVLKEMYIAIPPFDEQNRIVEKIKSIFAQLDTIQEIFLQ